MHKIPHIQLGVGDYQVLFSVSQDLFSVQLVVVLDKTCQFRSDLLSAAYIVRFDVQRQQGIVQAQAQQQKSFLQLTFRTCSIT